MDVACETMLWIGLAMWVGGIVLLIPEPPNLDGSLGDGASTESRRGVTPKHRRGRDTDVESAKFERHSLNLAKKWRPWIGVELLFAGLALLITVAVAIT